MVSQVMLRLEGLALMALGLSACCGSTSVESVASKGDSKVKKNDDSVLTLPSAHTHAETVKRFKALLADKGIRLFAEIDHAAEAKQVGQALRPTLVLIFGNPKAGTPLMQSKQTIGLDLPLRVLVWEDDRTKVWLTYSAVANLTTRHQVADRDEVAKTLDAVLSGLVRDATAP
jgi:uncharacterized protein (DUF302 family)